MSLLLINPGKRDLQLKFRFPVVISVSAWGFVWKECPVPLSAVFSNRSSVGLLLSSDGRNLISSLPAFQVSDVSLNNLTPLSS